MAYPKHPDYSSYNTSKYRYTYAGGTAFRNQYLKKFSKRETKADFATRKVMSYSPSHAKSLVNEIKNNLFQRLVGVTRVGGPQSYQDAVVGQGLGVDRKGSSMHQFIGREILPELLVMGKVGVYVDRAPINGTITTMADEIPDPYIYTYKREDIMNWIPQSPDKPGQFKAVVLNRCDYTTDAHGLPSTKEYSTILLKYEIEDDGTEVVVKYTQTDDGETREVLDVAFIPFVVFELTSSLLEDIADYQIALLNLESSDMNFILKANFPTYVEQRDEKNSSNHFRRPSNHQTVTTNEDGSQELNPNSPTETEDEVSIGTLDGRAYAAGLNAPSFIAPPTDPIKASMAKQQQMHEDMRVLVNLTLSGIKSVSAQAKAIDNLGTESGMSYIGLELEQGERMVAKAWAMYENAKAPEVNYPKTYELKSDADRIKEAGEIAERRGEVPSITYKKELSKRIVKIMLEGYVTVDTLNEIYEEIESGKLVICRPEDVFTAHERGIIDDIGAGEVLGVPEANVIKAREDHAERIKRIQAAQSSESIGDNPAARGIDDLNADPDAAKKEKEDSQNPDLDGQTRGKGK